MRETRAQESQEETAARLDAQKQRKKRRSEEESPESRERRLEAGRKRMRKTRAQESQEETAARLEADRAYRAEVRNVEEGQQREERLRVDRIRHNVLNMERRMRVRNGMHNIAFDFDPNGEYPDVSDIGTMDHICPFCNALKFPKQTKGECCNGGKTVTDPFPELPQFMKDLISGNDPNSRHFLEHIRQYNGSFSMTSFGHTEATVPGWNPSFIVQGQVHHRIGSLLAPLNTRPMFLQVYFLDAMEDQVRTRLFGQLKPEILQKLTEWFMENNQLIRTLKTARESIDETDADTRKIVIVEEKRPAGQHPRRYNAQNAPEVAILMDNEPTHDRDIVIKLRNGNLRRISELHASYDPMQYPVAFPFGTDGYNIYLKGRAAGGQAPGRKITMTQYYSYHIQVREGNYLLRLGRLFQQFLVDAFCKIEAANIGFIAREQKALRADNYANLHDNLILNDGDPRNVGQRVILPATFTGGPRWMHAKQADAMAYVRRFGCPDYFITMTCNPKWKEITDNLLQGQQPHDRPDLIAKVFNQKLKCLMTVLKNGGLGQLQAFLYTIEHQKRGLPHAHILEWVTPGDKVRPDDIDKVISAEIPDPVQHPDMHKLVMTHMVHGPCGAFNNSLPCMKDGKKCCHKFPKDFVEHTEQGNDSYPKYRRRDPENGGFVGTKTIHQYGRKVTQEVDNRWIVPYSPFLLAKFQCHINVEICSSIKSIKYVTKYITKGSDQAVFSLQRAPEENHNEIEQFQNARYVGCSEAAWRISGNKISENWPPVISLAVHLENGQRIVFPEADAMQAAEGPPPTTTLTAFFDLCGQDPFARTLKYHQVPEYYTWQNDGKCWKRRKRGTAVDDQEGVKKCSAIGRLHTINPKLTECYFVRLLLTDVVGPTSFQDLRTVDGRLLTYREACMARGLLRDDTHLHAAMEEASVSQSPESLRKLFAIILTSCEPSSPVGLWDAFKEHLSEDFLFQHREATNNQDAPFSDVIYNRALCRLEDAVRLLGGESLSTYDLPLPNRDINDDMNGDPVHDLQQDGLDADAAEASFTAEQRRIYQTIIAMADNPDAYAGRNIIFLDAPGGTGKTFLINSVLKRLRSQGKVAIATATSGIAATLIDSGRTLHSGFKIPIDSHLQTLPTCMISRGTALARKIQQCRLIVVDEAPMAHKSNYEALDRTLRDLCDPNSPMGGIPMLLCGDFRQLLPVVKRGTRSNVVNASLKKSYLWHQVNVMHLTTNMRAFTTGNASAKSFSDLLLTIGNGTIESSDDIIKIPGDLGHSVGSLEELRMCVYPDLQNNGMNPEWLAERAILSPLNKTVSTLNNWLLDTFPGQERLYKSTNTNINDAEAVVYPVEYLNSIELSGFPPHELRLKKGLPIMVLRNIAPPVITNGTRCIITRLHHNVIEAKVSCGPHKGEHIVLPRIPLEPSKNEVPFSFKRLQFPCKPCFAMTVHKAQGQTFKTVGVDLSELCFSHGQMYVACSRTGSPESLYLMTHNGESRNVVYKEVLQ